MVRSARARRCWRNGSSRVFFATASRRCDRIGSRICGRGEIGHEFVFFSAQRERGKIEARARDKGEAHHREAFVFKLLGQLLQKAAGQLAVVVGRGLEIGKQLQRQRLCHEEEEKRNY